MVNKYSITFPPHKTQSQQVVTESIKTNASVPVMKKLLIFNIKCQLPRQYVPMYAQMSNVYISTLPEDRFIYLQHKRPYFPCTMYEYKKQVLSER